MKILALVGVLFAAIMITVVETRAGVGKPMPETPKNPETPTIAPQKDTPAPVRGKIAPNVAGRWAGTWESIRNKGHGGTVSCDALEKSENEWTAVIYAEYGPEMKFNIDLKGICEDGKVVFDGKLDLGEEQGIYTWTGAATAAEFSGSYKGPGENGIFKMTRAKATAAASNAPVIPVVANP